jgi:hypothetical protein
MPCNEFLFGENGTALRVNSDGSWEITHGDRRWPLNEIKDFYRAWLLFEYPFETVSSKLDEMAQCVQSPRRFAFEKLVASALQTRNTNLINQGMDWVPYLSAHQIETLLDPLRDVTNTKIGSQRARQLARKHVNRA